MPEVESELARRTEAGEEVLLATVVGVDRSPPSRAGAKALFSRSGPIAGTLGCAEFDSSVLAETPDLLDRAEPASREYSHELGSIHVYLEPYPARPVLLVMGATPVAFHLLTWSSELGFAPTLYETRTERLAGRSPGPGVRHIENLAGLQGLAGHELYAVHTDHDAPDLVDTVQALLDLEPRFLGLMGSRRHTGHHLEKLRQAGVAEGRLERIQTPVGIEIGARSAAEIALSILAGVVAARREAVPAWLDSKTSMP